MKFRCNPVAYVVLPTDTPLERVRKKILLCMGVSVFAGFVLGIDSQAHATSGAGLIMAITMACALLILFVKKRVSVPMLAAVLMSGTICILVTDIHAVVVNGPRPNAAILVLVDLALVCRLHKSLPVGIVLAFTLQQALITSESVYRYGFYDLPGWGPTSDRFPRQCSKPPCPVTHEALKSASLILICCYVDFYFTKSFADSVIEENAKIESSISTTQIIADLIANFEIKEATRVLNEARGLPSELQLTLYKILSNLNGYKPYLPRSCFEFEIEDAIEAVSIERSCSDCISEKAELSESQTCSDLGISMRVGLTRCNATLVVTNIRNSLSVLNQSIIEYKVMHTTITETALSVFTSFKGVVELFVGDRFHVSFNAVKSIVSHAVSAVKAVAHFQANLIESLKFDDSMNLCNAGVATGSVVKGDLGSSEMRRFTELGTLTIAVQLIERFSRAKQHSMLCGKSTADQCTEIPLRLLPCTLLFHEELFLFEFSQLDQHTLVKAGEVVAGEWMYHIKSNPYSKYNKKMKVYLAQSSKQRFERNESLVRESISDHNSEEESRSDEELKCLLSKLLRDDDDTRRLPLCFGIYEMTNKKEARATEYFNQSL